VPFTIVRYAVPFTPYPLGVPAVCYRWWVCIRHTALPSLLWTYHTTTISTCSLPRIYGLPRYLPALPGALCHTLCTHCALGYNTLPRFTYVMQVARNPTLPDQHRAFTVCLHLPRTVPFTLPACRRCSYPVASLTACNIHPCTTPHITWWIPACRNLYLFVYLPAILPLAPVRGPLIYTFVDLRITGCIPCDYGDWFL